MSAKKPTPHTRPRSPIPRKQWYMPAGFHPDGRPAVFAKVVDPRTATVDGERLSDEQRRELTLLRIARQKHLHLGSLDGGVIDKARALREVEEGTALGAVLVDIEHRAIRLMREYAERRPSRKKTPRKATHVRKKARRHK